MSGKRVMFIGLDGADAMVVKRMIGEGKLPNMKKLLDLGVTTESYGHLCAMPTVTPPNWITLATGASPRTHGVCDFYHHTIGKPLDIQETGWNSQRVKVETIWQRFAKEGKRSILFNYVGAWPPTTENDIYLDGQYVYTNMYLNCDFEKIVTLEDGDFPVKEIPHSMDPKAGDCVIHSEIFEKLMREEMPPVSEKEKNVGKDRPVVKTKTDKSHTVRGEMDCPVVDRAEIGGAKHEGVKADLITSPMKPAKDWNNVPAGTKEALIPLNKGEVRRFVLVVAEDGKKYNKVQIYANRKADKPLGEAKLGEWSDIIFDSYSLKGVKTPVVYRIKVFELSPDGSKIRFYISHTSRLTNLEQCQPDGLMDEIFNAIGPNLTFANHDRYNAEADRIILESFAFGYEWHAKAAHYVFDKYPDWQLFYIHLHAIDLMNHWYINESIKGSSPTWQDNAKNIEAIYKISDKFVGEMMKYLDGNTTIILTSDHAAIPRSPGYQNPVIGEISGITAKVMMDLGYTTVNHSSDGRIKVDWKKTIAVNRGTSHIYLNLKGRDPEGIIDPADYEKTVDKIIDGLYAYRDPKSGERVISFCMNREEMESVGLGGKDSGDIFFQLRPDFCMGHSHVPPFVSNHGYSMLPVLIMGGAGLKQGGHIIKRIVRAVDIVPTMCHLAGVKVPADVEGGIIYQALEEF